MNQDDFAKLFLGGGLALMALGAGVIMAHPELRKSLMPLASNLSEIFPDLLGDANLEELQKASVRQEMEGVDPLQLMISTILPDIERYVKLRSM